MAKKKSAMRKALMLFRLDKHLTQAEMAEKTGVSVKTYNYIENGVRSGKQEFWDKLQQAFNVSDSEMFPLQKIERV